MSFQVLLNSSVVQSQKRADIPHFEVGSVVAVYYKIKEGEKERIQMFEGLVTNKHEETNLNGSFTVVKNSFSAVKIERTFPFHSPSIDKLVVLSSRRARRANLNKLAFETKDLAKTLRTKPLKVAAKAKVAVKSKEKVEAETAKVEAPEEVSVA